MLLLSALALSVTTIDALAREYAAGSIKVSQVWARVPPAGAKVAGGFMTLTNTGKEADRLIGGTALVAGRFEVHEMRMSDGIMKMRELKDGLEIKPGETVALKPGSYHIMLMDLKAPLVAGTPFKGTLVFAKGGTIEIEFQVAPLGAKTIDGDGGHAKEPGGGHGSPVKGQAK
jgi:hypothetical protein